MIEQDQQRWNVCLSPWIIQDGNYPDFKRSGDPVGFALEFYSESGLKKIGPKNPNAIFTGGSEYQVEAKVIHLASNWWTIDFGVLAYREETPPAGLAVGDFVRGTINLGVDPFFYFEYLFKSTGSPALIYDWQILGIIRVTAPLIQAPGGKMMIRDETKEVIEKVNQTDAWHDDVDLARSVDYCLQCRPLTGPRFPAPVGTRT